MNTNNVAYTIGEGIGDGILGYVGAHISNAILQTSFTPSYAAVAFFSYDVIQTSLYHGCKYALEKHNIPSILQFGLPSASRGTALITTAMFLKKMGMIASIPPVVHYLGLITGTWMAANVTGMIGMKILMNYNADYCCSSGFGMAALAGWKFVQFTGACSQVPTIITLWGAVSFAYLGYLSITKALINRYNTLVSRMSIDPLELERQRQLASQSASQVPN
jgi:hypothetical protein